MYPYATLNINLYRFNVLICSYWLWEQHKVIQAIGQVWLVKQVIENEFSTDDTLHSIAVLIKVLFLKQ